MTAAQAFRSGDFVVATPQNRATPCVLDLTTVSGAPVGINVTVTLGMANASNGVLFGFGQTPRFVVYAVRSGQLTICDLMQQDCTSSDASNWPAVADGVVSLRAEYARDTTATRDAIPDVFDQTTPTNCPGWSRIVAIHAALVVRGRQPEKQDVPASAPAWTHGASSPDISLSGSDWKRYHYRTYETTIPLRNMPGAADQNISSC